MLRSPSGVHTCNDNSRYTCRMQYYQILLSWLPPTDEVGRAHHNFRIQELLLFVSHLPLLFRRLSKCRYICPEGLFLLSWYCLFKLFQCTNKVILIKCLVTSLSLNSQWSRSRQWSRRAEATFQEVHCHRPLYFVSWPVYSQVSDGYMLVLISSGK